MTAPTGAIARIDLAALCDNYRLLAAKAAPAACSAVVKANAYGLGAERVAQALWQGGCSHFFTVSIAEAISLRTVLPQAFIGVFYGVASGEDARLCLAHRLMPCLNSLGQIELWRKAALAQGAPLPAALHVDTGMNRLGLAGEEVALLAQSPEKLDGIEVQWLMSHLACADTPQHPLNALQLRRFTEACGHFPEWPTSLANSSGIFLGTDWHGDLVRPGAALYGINPVPHLPNPMKTVVTIEAPVVQLRELRAEDTVGYGATYKAPAGARLATVACGYADGIMRSMSNRSEAFVAGQRVPVAGIVSMDVTVIDISSLPEGAVQPGDRVEFIGPHIAVDTVAEQAATIGYELFTSIGGRVRREYSE